MTSGVQTYPTTNRTASSERAPVNRSVHYTPLPAACLTALWDRLRVDRCVCRWPGYSCYLMSIPGRSQCNKGHALVKNSPAHWSPF
jgi:hypothetical protein